MKKLYTAFILIFIIFFIITIVYSLIYLQKEGVAFLPEENGLGNNNTKPVYHFAVIAQNTDDPFWHSVKDGIAEAAKQFNVAVEFNGPRFTNLQEEMQYLDIAIASKVDGIVTHVQDEKQFGILIDKAAAKNIPVVTIEADAKNSKRKSFIGTSSFKLGSEGGKLVAEATGGKANVAMIFNTYSSDGENVVQNLKIAGFNDATKDLHDIKIKTIQTSGTGIFSAEEVTKNILINFPDVNVIYCTSPKDSVGAAQVIVDLNRVGDIIIIGYDDIPDILRYVEKDVIFGTVASNPKKMGYESIKTLFELKTRNMASSYIDTGVHVITSKNLSEYTHEQSKVKGQEDGK